MTELQAIPAETRLAQKKATDPKSSAWVSANAGSGKTFVLSRRVMRLLLDGTEPSRILCLTFTKAAAAEMSNRIFAQLGKWATSGDGELEKALSDILDRSPTGAETSRARTLFAGSLDSPGGLKIQTIHAFCEALLHQFPFEANISGSFEVIDEARQQELIAEARRQVILELETGSVVDAAILRLRAAFAGLLKLAGDGRIEAAISQLVTARDSFRLWADGDVEGAMAPLWESQGMTPLMAEGDMLAAAMAERTAFDALLPQILARAHEKGKKTDHATAALLHELSDSIDPREQFRLRLQVFLTKNREPKAISSIFTLSVLKSIDGLEAMVEDEKERMRLLLRRHQSWHILRSSHLLFMIGEAIIDRYLQLKRRGGYADFDDLVTNAGHLLARPDVGPWIQFKLDKGIDHILVDEAQDTNRRQWAIIDALVAEFFAGAGQTPRTRTLFAVGDAKQSIFSFQGADPRLFAVQARKLKRLAAGSRLAFEGVRLNLSFRSTPDVLEAVDVVFGIAENFKGLSSEPGEDRTQHEAIRRSDPGEVWIWPLVSRERPENRTSWLEPLDHKGADHPADVLACRIAKTIKGWIERGEKLPGRENPIRCGDILILVRRRDFFSTTVVRRLKEAGLKIAGADRLALTGHIAVEDLMALGRFVLMPEDDLSLASVLKSPLFGFDDDDLIALTLDRGPGSLFDHLCSLTSDSRQFDGNEGLYAKVRAAIEKSARLTALARHVSPYRFYSRVLGAEGGRRAFISRLGTEAGDVLDAFEEATLDHSARNVAGLESFLASLVRTAPEVKREIDMRTDEIRVITVHSAKGLEAPVVFLVDPCSPPFSRKHLPSVIQFGEPGADGGFVWANGDRKAMDTIVEHDSETETRADEEYRRLLYVGMTRAADRLVVCGWYNLQAPKPPYWHWMVETALAQDSEKIDTGDGWEFRKWQSRNPNTMAARREKLLSPAKEISLNPDPATAWLLWEPELERPIARRVSPSRAVDGSPAPRAGATENLRETRVASGEFRDEVRSALDRGTLTHLLLQHLPAVDPALRPPAAKRIVERNIAGLSEEENRQVVDEVLNLLGDPAHADLFGPSSRAEIRVEGNVSIRGIDIAVAGQIDRIIVQPGLVEIIDFKTNRSVPAGIEATPPTYILQMALYRELLKQIYPEARVACSLLWTSTNHLMRVDDSSMDRALAEMTLT